nr:MAG TPA: hypothetical protein [Bacteriophage sp.]
MSALCTFASNKLIINREKRADASTLCIHCRQHSLLAAVLFTPQGERLSGIGRADFLLLQLFFRSPYGVGHCQYTAYFTCTCMTV